MKFYVDERKNNFIDRISLAIILAIVLYAFSCLIEIKHLSLGEGIINNVILVLVTEYSFEFNDKKLMIRSNGKFYELDGLLKLITYPFAILFAMLGLRNQPIWAWLTALVYLYGMIFHDWQVFDATAHLGIMYILYKNRKENK